ncbi:hypothetical protein RCS94_00560 [Orbaceae bacterium ac157xtp]
MLIVPSSYGALSATSANTIKGNAPTFMGQSGANKLGFKVGNTLYSESVGNIVGSSEKIFDRTLKLDEFVAQALTVNDFTVASDYYDADGDPAHPTDAFTMGSVRSEWFDANNVKITDTSKTVGCSGFTLPLTMKITLTNVQVQSKYGDPRLSQRENLVKSYKIATNSGICFAKPGSLYWKEWNYNGSYRDPVRGGGYTADFVPNNGFRAVPKVSSSTFPTTGFVGANFKLVMSGSSSSYDFSSNSSAVSVNSDGKVVFNSKPNGYVTIKVKLKNSNPAVVYEYKFNPTSIWLTPNWNSAHTYGYYTYTEAKNLCGGESRLPSRAQLTNSPQNSFPFGMVGIPSSAYTRAIGEGVFSEWGEVDQYSYPTWWGGSYLTREAYSSYGQFDVSSRSGVVGWIRFEDGNLVACLS